MFLPMHSMQKDCFKLNCRLRTDMQHGYSFGVLGVGHLVHHARRWPRVYYVITMPLANKSCDAVYIAKCKSHLLAELQVTSCLLFPNDVGRNYMLQQVHTSLQFIQEAHYRLMVDGTHNCCNVMIHLVHMLCDLIRFHGDGWVAMRLTVVGTKLNSESKVVRILEKNRITAR